MPNHDQFRKKNNCAKIIKRLSDCLKKENFSKVRCNSYKVALQLCLNRSPHQYLTGP